MDLGVGIVGCGAIAQLHIDAFNQMEGVQIRAVSDAVKTVAERVGAKLNVSAYGDYNEMLARPDIDVVSICTPSGLHQDIALAAARAHKHVIVEKPLEVTVEKIDRIIETCKENGVTLASIFNNRYREGNRFVKRAIESGRFGSIISANACVKWYRKPEYYANSNWRGTWAIDGGGALMNQSIHYLDLLLWFAGDVEAVKGYTATLLHKSIETEDTAAATFKFKSGAIGSIVCGTSYYSGFPAVVEITGERGYAAVTDSGIAEWKFIDSDPMDEEAALYAENGHDNARASDPMAFDSHYHRLQLENIISSIRNGTEPEVNGYEARKPVRVIRAIYESSRTGNEIVLD